MADTTLARELADERGLAVRTLLARPLIDAGHDPEGYGIVVRHRSWLADWFETACGWRLVVDTQGSFARLHKRRATPDPTRPLRRLRGARAPFDRRRYELLCRICAEIVNPPMTTLGILAAQLVTATSGESHERFDSSLRRERAAFVDVLLMLANLGVIRISSGDVGAYVDDPNGNAILSADVARLHQLLSSSAAPSRIEASTVIEAIDKLSAEPRYELEVDGPVVDNSRRNQALRHRLARCLLDDPVMHRDDLTDDEAAYLDSGSGRKWLRDRIDEAGLLVELRAEGAMAIDENGGSSDLRFPAPEGNVWQVALLLIDRFVVTSARGRRELVEQSLTQLEAKVADELRKHPKWAKRYRTDGGAELLAAEAVDVLVALGLARRNSTFVQPRPAMARYRPAEAVIGRPYEAPTLFDHMEGSDG